jgi:hypothetical protein
MLEAGGPLILSRRNLLVLVGGGLAAWRPVHATTSGFWNKKPPQDWSREEIDALITKSPWAKEASAQGAAQEGGYGSPSGSPNGTGYPGGGGGGYPGGGGMGGPRIGIPGIGGIGMGGGGRRMGGNQGGGRGQQRGALYRGTVRWESAQPVLDALKSPLPEAFANHYVIAVIGFPLPASPRRYQDEEGDNPPRRSQDDALDNLKHFTTLQPRGKELAQAGIVQQQTSSNSNLLFGFSKDSLTLTKDDKEVLFSTTLGRLVIRAKFDPKEMLYRGQLAV